MKSIHVEENVKFRWLEENHQIAPSSKTNLTNLLLFYGEL